MKVVTCILLSFSLIHFFAEANAQFFAVADSTSTYQQLSKNKEYNPAARMAFMIAEYYTQKRDHAKAREFYANAGLNANRGANVVLEARAIYKQGMAEKMMVESGIYSMEEEQKYLKACIKSMKRAHNLFIKAKMQGSYEDIMSLVHGGEAQFIIGDYRGAIKALKIALRDAQKNRYNELALKSSGLLAQSFAESNDPASEAFYLSIYKNYNEFFISKDSLAQSVEEIVKLESTNQLQKTELELTKIEIQNKNLQLENQNAMAEKTMAIIEQGVLERRLMIGSIGVILIILIISIVALQYKRKTANKLEEQNKKILKQKTLIEKRQKELNDEKSRTDALLLNILPEPIAEELKKKKKVTPRYYKMVTVMFTDFKGFTAIASQMSPGEIVRELDACFVAFDLIIEKYELRVGRKCIEKIKTIGDGYMCAGGVPIENESNPLDTIRVALAIRDYMEKRKLEKAKKNEPFFEIRIGINTGPVVAGVVGKKKFAYDIWGDTVNLASRMESSGEVGRVNISGETYKYIKDHFFFTKRGRINAKNKGSVDMYFVDGRVKYASQKKKITKTKV